MLAEFDNDRSLVVLEVHTCVDLAKGSFFKWRVDLISVFNLEIFQTLNGNIGVLWLHLFKIFAFLLFYN